MIPSPADYMAEWKNEPLDPKTKKNKKQKQLVNHERPRPMVAQLLKVMGELARGGEKPRSDCPGQVNFALGQVKMEVWWSGRVKFASVV